MDKPNIGRMVSRRSLLSQMCALGIAPVLSGMGTDQAAKPFSDEDDAFLEELEHANLLYFWEQANPQTGLVRDRYTVRGSDRGGVASIAATGFGLTALCIAERRGYLSHLQVRDRVLATVRFLWRKLPHHRGF